MIITYRPQSSSFWGLPYRSLNMNPQKGTVLGPLGLHRGNTRPSNRITASGLRVMHIKSRRLDVCRLHNGNIPIVSIVVPFFGLTNSILRIPKGNPKKELQWRLQVGFYIPKSRSLQLVRTLGSTYSLHCSSFLGLPCRILLIYLGKPKKELQWRL